MRGERRHGSPLQDPLLCASFQDHSGILREKPSDEGRPLSLKQALLVLESAVFLLQVLYNGSEFVDFGFQLFIFALSFHQRDGHASNFLAKVQFLLHVLVQGIFQLTIPGAQRLIIGPQLMDQLDQIRHFGRHSTRTNSKLEVVPPVLFRV